MESYVGEVDAANIVDTIQVKHECCGHHSWLDWSIAQPIVEVSSTTTETTPTPAPPATRYGPNSTTTSAPEGEGEVTTPNALSETTASTNRCKKRYVSLENG